jgi:aminoglycoside phosphotransferase (APT) family kinase protein
MTSLDPAKLQSILSTALPGRQLHGCTPLGGGFSNALYRVDVSAGTGDPVQPVVLRIFVRDGTRCAIESALAGKLRGIVPVPEVLWSDPGGEMIGQPFTLVQWVDGVLVDQVLAGGTVADVTAVGREVGAVLASIGSIRFNSAGFFGDGALEPRPLRNPAPEQLLTYVYARLFEGPAQDALDPSTRDAWWRLISDAAPCLHSVEGARSLVHADFNGKNLMVRNGPGGWQVAGVLDWEFAFSGSSLADVGNMLRFADEYPTGYADAFLTGFTAHGGSLPDDWQRIARTLDVFSIVDFLCRSPDNPFREKARKLISAAVDRGFL